jgi:hypothetical protein
MIYFVYVPLLLPGLLSWAAWRAVDRAAPSVAVPGLVAGAVVTAAASVWSLMLLALTLFDDLPPLSALDERPELHLPEPVPGPVALLAAIALAWGAVRLVRDLRRRRHTTRWLREIGAPRDSLVVADWTAPMAVAVPGRPGHLLVTTGMLRELDAPQRRAVLAHERAHLAHRHHLAATCVAAAAAVNQLLVPVRDAVAYLLERWADEDAAAELGDRELVARTVARAALATVGAGKSTALGVHGGIVVRRIRALDRPPLQVAGHTLTMTDVIAAGSLVAGGAATRDFVGVAAAWLG